MSRVLPYALLFCAYLTALPLDFISIDSAELSQVARESDGLHLTVFGRPYQNKPPLLFWLVDISRAIFGDNRFAYRLPSVLALLAAAFFTRRLAQERRIDGPVLAIFFTTVVALQMVFDVRCDTLLMACTAFSLWALLRYLREQSWQAALLLGAGVGLGWLAKGPVTLVVCGGAAVADMVARREFRALYRPMWLFALPVLALLLLPFCVGQYEQYGAQGVRFFLWTASFGRITGENTWDNRAQLGPLFFTHTTLWQYLPWTPFLLLGLWRLRKDGFLAGGFLLGLLAMEMSRYKLPHYFYPVYPLGVLLVSAGYREVPRWIGAAVVAIAVAFVAVTTVFFPAVPWWVLAAVAAWRAPALPQRIAVAVAIIGLTLHLQLLPGLLQYQSGLQAARIIGSSSERVVLYEHWDTFFYDAMERAPEKDVAPGVQWVFTSQRGKDDLLGRGFIVEKEHALKELAGSTLQPRQLLPSVRDQAATTNYLLYGRMP